MVQLSDRMTNVNVIVKFVLVFYDPVHGGRRSMLSKRLQLVVPKAWSA